MKKNWVSGIAAVGVLGATAFSVLPARSCADGSCEMSKSHDAETAAKHSKNDVVSTQTASANEKWLIKLREESDAAFHKGDYPLAIQKFKAIVAIDPTDFDAFGTAAWLMWSLGNGDEATAFMRRGIAGDPKNWEMWEEAGAHFTLRKTLLDEAQRDFERALELAPKDANTRLLRHRIAFAREGNGQLKSARDMWSEIVRQFPDDAVAVRKLKEVEAKIAAPSESSTGTMA